MIQYTLKFNMHMIIHEMRKGILIFVDLFTGSQTYKSSSQMQAGKLEEENIQSGHSPFN